MTSQEVALARDDYCFGKTCRNCIFRTYARDKFNTNCGDLTPDQIRYILSIIKVAKYCNNDVLATEAVFEATHKEEGSMTKKEEIQQEIEKTQKQLAALQEKLKEAEEEVPEELIFIKDNDEYYYVNDAGTICETRCALLLSDARRIRNRRAFLSEEYAKAFAEKTQIIADMLHFKWLYDRDYKPDSNNGFEYKHGVYYNSGARKFESGFATAHLHTESVYFSTAELARKCADWLNRKYGYTKE